MKVNVIMWKRKKEKTAVRSQDVRREKTRKCDEQIKKLRERKSEANEEYG